MLNKIFSILSSLLFSTSFLNSNVLVVNAEENQIDIYKSVDDDLKEFNFDYERYFINESLVYRPIIINFNESLSSEYTDLLYIYDPHDLLDENTIQYDVLTSSDGKTFNHYDSCTKTIFAAGTSSDGKVKRYAINGYESFRDTAKYREYQIKTLDEYSVDSIYRFGPSNTLEYANSINMYLEDPHNWSWHFDEDNWWENVKDWFTSSDVLKDQLFYSFKIPEGWNVNEIKSIDIQYKKVLLEGYRATVADKNSTHNYYKNVNDEIYKPIFYKWNDNNSSTYLDKTNMLGNSISDIGNKVSYTYKTIKPSSVTSSTNNLQKTYKWNSIQNVSSFKQAFGAESDIYKFASSFYVNDDEDYWIINYDDFYYSYQMKNLHYYDKNKFTGNKTYNNDNSLLANYLIEEGNVIGYDADSYMDITRYYVNSYHFIEEYTFDITARYITYSDCFGFVRTAACSVAPVMEKEGSGGTSDSPFPTLPDPDDLWKLIMLILGVVGLTFIFICSVSIFDKISNIGTKSKVRKIDKRFNDLYKDKPKK